MAIQNSSVFYNLDACIITTFLVAIAVIGMLTARRVKTLPDYIAYNQKYNPVLIGLSLTMVIFGSGTVVGGVEEVYEVGIIYALATIGYIVNGLLTAKYIIPKIDKKFTGMVTAPDLFGYFYGKNAEKFSSIIAIIFDIGASASQLVAAGKLCAYFLGLPYSIGIFGIGSVMMIYSALGGIRTITILDIMKCLLIIIFMPFMAGIFVFKAGGLFNISQSVAQEHLLILGHKQFFKYLILFFVFSMPIHMLQPIVVQRILMINSINISQKSMYIYSFIRCALLFVVIAIGLSIALDQSFVHKNIFYDSIMLKIPDGLKGFIISTFLVIVMSKADAHTNSSGMILLKNVFSNQWRQKIGDLSLARLCTCFVVLISVCLASLNIPIVKTIIFIELMWGVLIGLPMLVALLLQRGDSKVLWTYLLWISPGFIAFCFYNRFSWMLLALLLTSAALFLSTALVIDCKMRVQLSKFYRAAMESLARFKGIRLSFKSLTEFSAKRVKIVGAEYFTFVIFFAINYTVPIIFSTHSMENIASIMRLRFISVILCFILLAKNWWSAKLEPYFALYWYFVLAFTLPFLSLFIAILSQWSTYCLISLSLSLLLLMILTDWLMFLIITVIGSGSALTLCTFLYNGKIFPDIWHCGLIVYSIGFSILIGLLFSRKREEVFANRVEMAKICGEVVAHEMRTFLLAMRNYVCGYKKHFRVLVNSDSVSSAGGGKSNLNAAQISALKNSIHSMEHIINKAFSFINSLLFNLKGPSLQEVPDKHFAGTAIKNALEKYPLSAQENKFIKINIVADFLFEGNADIFTHVIFNLIDNALYFIANKENPEILIDIEKGREWSRIVVRDNGAGIDKSEIAKIFDRFYSKGKKGTGLGLSFCKKAMDMMGGCIECHSEKNEFTKFILKFPNV